MAKNWGRNAVTNADKVHTATKTRYWVETDDGLEERIGRRPMGKVEQFVDKSGNVIGAQLYTDGDPHRASTEINERAKLYRKGCVEHAKCPLKHGGRYSSEITRKDFAKMPAELEGECTKDPKVMERVDGDLYARKSCKHIEWLIEYRVQKAAQEYALRNAHVAAAEKAKKEESELKAVQLEMAKEQLAERRQRKPKTKEVAE